MGIISSGNRLCIDIRGRVMKFMQARYNKQNGCIDIKSYGSIEFSQEHIKYGQLCENEETVKTITNFVKKEGMRGKRVYLNISDPSVVLRIVKMPFMSAKSLKNHLNIEIAQYLPIDTATNVYDYKIIDIFEEDGKKMMNILLTSASKEVISNYISLFEKSGLKLEVIDVYPNSISRIFGAEKDRDIAIVEINDNIIDFVIITKGKLFMYSTSNISSDMLCRDKLGKNINLILEEDGAFAGALDEVANFVKTYMTFFSSRNFGKSIDVVYILGELSLINGIDTFFNEQLQAGIRLGLPEVYKVKAPVNTTDFKMNLVVNERITMYSCNMGLVLRGVNIGA